MTDSSQIADLATEIFARQLTSEWTREKTPYRLTDTWEHACSAPAQDTARIFLDSGFSAWLAYFLTTNNQGRHYKGQHVDLQTLAAFEQLPTEDRRTVATKLVNTEAHPTVSSAIEQLLNRSKRRRLDGTEQLSSSPSPSTTRTAMRPSNEAQSRLTANYQTTFDSAPNCTAEPGPTTSTKRTCSTSGALQSETSDSMAVTSSSLDQQTVSDPTIKRIASIFPQYLCGAIRKTGDTAAVMIVFPSYYPGGKVACLMSLAILPNKVQYLAMELFGTHLETEDGFWYAVQENGGRLFLQEVVLQGAQDKAIAKLLGPETNHAIAMSPVRKEEVRQAILATRCVTLRITSSCHDDAILNLNLGLEEGFRLKEELFK